MASISASSYRSLAAFRHEVRKFTAFSEQAARSAGLEPQEHQALLQLRGLPKRVRPTVGVLAERLCVKHHTALYVAHKLEARKLVRREHTPRDRRVVLLRLTQKGEALLRRVSAQHARRLRATGPALVASLETVLGTRRSSERRSAQTRT